MEQAPIVYRARVTEGSRRRARFIVGASLLLFAGWAALAAFFPSPVQALGGSGLLGMIVPLAGMAIGWFLILEEGAYVRVGLTGLEIKLPGLNAKNLEVVDILRSEARQQPRFGGFGFFGILLVEVWRRLSRQSDGHERLSGVLRIWVRDWPFPKTFDLTFLAPQDFEELTKILASRIQVVR